MADVSDVSDVIVGLITGLLYPNGTGEASAFGVDARVFAGWPAPERLDADLKMGWANVSVFPQPTVRNVTRWPLTWQQMTNNQPTLTLGFSGQAITVGGVVTVPHNMMVMVNYLPYVYAVQKTDTLSTIAAALSALISVAVPGTTSSGPVITCPAGANITVARVGVFQTMLQVIRTQERVFQISVWAADNKRRKTLAQPLDVFLANTPWITLPDLTGGRLRYVGEHEIDNLQKQSIYRRDFLYTVEYSTTISSNNAEVVSTKLNVGADIAGVPPATPVTTVYN